MYEIINFGSWKSVNTMMCTIHMAWDMVISPDLTTSREETSYSRCKIAIC